MSPTSIPAETRTMAQRIAEGRLPAAEALRYAMLLAETLRRLHDEGKAHGALTPQCVALTAFGLELTPAPAGAVTPYTAPELIDGAEPDARSDVFSFGAIFYEMLTGRRAFPADGPALKVALGSGELASTGNAAVDRLVGNCLVADPAARWPRMQKVLMELKLLTVAARRTDSQLSQRRVDMEAALRAEIRQAETRIAARLDAQEKAGMELQASAAEALRSLRAQIESIESRLAETAAHALPAEALEAAEERLMARFVQGLEAAHQRIVQGEQGLDGVRQQAADLQKCVAADLHDLEVAVRAQDAAVQSARTALAQTDDLVERVVEALESLQSTVLDNAEERALIN